MLSDTRMLPQIREISRVVFGSPFRLEIVAAIHRLPSSSFTTGELKAIVEDPLRGLDNNVGRQLKKLSESSLIMKVGEQLWYRNPSPLWEFCNDWLASLLVGSEPPHAVPDGSTQAELFNS